MSYSLEQARAQLEAIHEDGNKFFITSYHTQQHPTKPNTLKKVYHKPIGCVSIDQGIRTIKQELDQGFDVLYTYGNFDLTANTRKQDLAYSCKTFVLDVDVRAGVPNHYGDKQSAWAGINQLADFYGLPQPTIYDSGGGYHCYWIMDASLSRHDWDELAIKLKTVFRINQTPATSDLTRVSDIAGVLRVAGTQNSKYLAGTAPVHCVQTGTIIPYADMIRAIDGAVTKAGIDASHLNQPLPSSSIANPLASGGTPSKDFASVYRACNFVASCTDHPESVSEPEWYSLLGLMQGVSQGSEFIHLISEGHPDYDANDTTQKFDQYKNQVKGLPRCQYIKDFGRCVGCKHNKPVTTEATLRQSPIKFAKAVSTTRTPLATMNAIRMKRGALPIETKEEPVESAVYNLLGAGIQPPSDLMTGVGEPEGVFIQEAVATPTPDIVPEAEVKGDRLLNVVDIDNGHKLTIPVTVVDPSDTLSGTRTITVNMPQVPVGYEIEEGTGSIIGGVFSSDDGECSVSSLPIWMESIEVGYTTSGSTDETQAVIKWLDDSGRISFSQESLSVLCDPTALKPFALKKKLPLNQTTDVPNLAAYFWDCAKVLSSGKAGTSRRIPLHQRLGWFDADAVEDPETKPSFIMYNRKLTLNQDDTIARQVCSHGDDLTNLKIVSKDATNYKPKAGSYAKWKSAVNLYKHRGFEGQAAMVMLSFASTLMHFTKYNGMIVNATGHASAGKSTALKFASSIWGKPRESHIEKEDTTTSWRNAIAACGNMPVMFDEITRIDEESLKDLVFSMYSGQDRARADVTGKTRERKDTWSTLMLSTSNRSLSDVLTENDMLDNSYQKRVLELNLTPYRDRGNGLAKRLLPDDPNAEIKTIMDAAERTLASNYGHAGEEFITYVLSNVTGIQAKLDAESRDLTRLYGSDVATDYRIHMGVLSALRVASHVCERMNIVEFDMKAVENWITDQMKHRFKGFEKNAEPVHIRSAKAVLNVAIDRYSDCMFQIPEPLGNGSGTVDGSFVANNALDVLNFKRTLKATSSDPADRLALDSAGQLWFDPIAADNGNIPSAYTHLVLDYKLLNHIMGTHQITIDTLMDGARELGLFPEKVSYNKKLGRKTNVTVFSSDGLKLVWNPNVLGRGYTTVTPPDNVTSIHKNC